MSDDTPFETGTPLRTVAPGVHVCTTIGHVVTIEASTGIVQVDTGVIEPMSEAVIAEIRTVTDLPIETIVYSHGHLGYNEACPAWLRHTEARGEPRPEIVAHANLVRRYDRYRRTSGLQQRINEIQFRLPKGTLTTRPVRLTDPDRTFDDHLVLDPDGRRIELFWAPSETDDALAVWLPDERILYGGAATIEGLPNIGTPMRTMRETMRWVATLDSMATLEPELLIREHGPEIEGAGDVQEYLTSTARFLRHVYDETIALLNQGQLPDEIVHQLDVPPELDRPWLQPAYGHVDYIVRDICRSELGWWTDWNPTHLHPAVTSDAAAAVASAIADPAAVLERARALRDDGRIDLALHVVDLLALDTPQAEARALKAELCDLAADQATSYVSQSLYRWSASELRGSPT